jgi:hypothetical protein
MDDASGVTNASAGSDLVAEVGGGEEERSMVQDRAPSAVAAVVPVGNSGLGLSCDFSILPVGVDDGRARPAQEFLELPFTAVAGRAREHEIGAGNECNLLAAGAGFGSLIFLPPRDCKGRPGEFPGFPMLRALGALSDSDSRGSRILTSLPRALKMQFAGRSFIFRDHTY